MSITPVPHPVPVADPSLPSNLGTRGAPAPTFTPNPYGISDEIVSQRAAGEAELASRGFDTALHQLWNAAIGDDLNAAMDPNQSAATRLLHAGLAASTVAPGLDLASLGLKFAGKEMLKGGIEQLTYHAAGKEAVAGEKLVLQGGVKLSSKEADVAALYAERGHQVIAKPATGLGQSADFVIDGKPTELKTLSRVKSNRTGEAVTSTIESASGQAKNIIIDARNQRGLTEAKARNAVKNAVDDLARSRVDTIHFLGRDGNRLYEFTMTKK